MTGLGITPERVARAIWLYKNGEPLAAIQKATKIPLKHLKRIIAKHDMQFGDDSWTTLLSPIHQWMNDVARASAEHIDEMARENVEARTRRYEDEDNNQT